MRDFKKIYDYIIQTPENMNPALLKQLIEKEYPKLGVPVTIDFPENQLELLEILNAAEFNIITGTIFNSKANLMDLNINNYDTGIPFYNDGRYILGLIFNTDTDKLDITVNGEQIDWNSWDVNMYGAVVISETYPTHYDLVVRVK